MPFELTERHILEPKNSDFTVHDRVQVTLEDGTVTLLWRHSAEVVDLHAAPQALKALMPDAEEKAAKYLYDYKGWGRQEIETARQMGILTVLRDCYLEIGGYLRCKLIGSFGSDDALDHWTPQSPIATVVPITLEEDQNQKG